MPKFAEDIQKKLKKNDRQMALAVVGSGESTQWVKFKRAKSDRISMRKVVGVYHASGETPEQFMKRLVEEYGDNER